MTVRAKLTVSEITECAYSKEARKIKLQCIYDQNLPEDQRFAKATPSGTIELWVDNPSAVAFFEIGKALYVDFTPAE